MLKKTITYEDYNGNERTEDYYFDLSEVEIVKLESKMPGGFIATLDRLKYEQNQSELFDIFEMLILKSYGEKSTDGRRFVKSDELSKAFSETRAYSKLFVELTTGDDVAEKVADFINGVIPNIPDSEKKGTSSPVFIPVK